MSEYTKLKQKGMGRGRPRHTPEQRRLSQVMNSMRQEARRRAGIVLKNKHEDEFNDIYEQELKSLIAEAAQKNKKPKVARK